LYFKFRENVAVSSIFQNGVTDYQYSVYVSYLCYAIVLESHIFELRWKVAYAYDVHVIMIYGS